MRLFVEMVNVCKEKGEGEVRYQWNKPGFNQPVQKISYVKLMKEWGWVVGSGIYVGHRLSALSHGLLPREGNAQRP